MLSMVPVEPLDRPFLFELYVSTRQEEMAAWGWDFSQQQAFLQMQFQIRESAYRYQFPQLEGLILVNGEDRVGAVQLARSLTEIRLVDLALLPRFRNQGLGTALLRCLQREAEESHRSVTLHVTPTNPARRLYERLGFLPVSETETHLALRWWPRGISHEVKDG